jgi:malonyl-CoA/methylmalonyl-CoA synthetase
LELDRHDQAGSWQGAGAMGSSLALRLDSLRAQDHAALVDDHARRSFEELWQHALGVRSALLAGAASLDGQPVGLLAAPGVAWVEAFLGIVLAGGVALPLSPLYPPAELAWFVADAKATVIVASADQAARAAALGAEHVLPLEAIAKPDDASPDLRELSDDATALLLYTSGTTGKPKGAMITHKNLALQAELLREAWGYSPNDVLLHTLPLHHLHGLGISLLTSILAGATTRMLARFDASRVWDGLGDATLFMAVPTMYQKLFEAFDAADAPTRARWAAGARQLRLATSGSAALPVVLAERWRQLTGAIPLERFGMTEIGVGMTNPLDPTRRRPGHVGYPLRTVELRLIDDAGADTEVGPGEIWIRGPSVFRGYHARAEATEEAFSDGWFKTGDLAERAADGSVRILGRTSVDILKSGGYKLSALEIEEVLRDHAAIAEVAVVGIPDEIWGDCVVAVIVARHGGAAECALEPLRAWAKQRLAPYKLPRRAVVVDALPRNAVGKVVKPELIRAILRDELG